MRASSIALAVALAAPLVAHAQPAAPHDPGATTAADPELDEAVAAGLHQRGVELFDAGDVRSARTLFIESLQRSPEGATSREALRMLRAANQQLGRPPDDGRPRTVPRGVDDPPAGPLDPYGDRSGGVAVARREAAVTMRGPLAVFGGAAGALVGLALMGPENDDGRIGGGALAVAALGGALGFAATLVADHRGDPSAGQRAAIATGGMLGGLSVGLLTDVVTGDRDDGYATSANQIYRGAALGAVLGTAGGAWWAHAKPSVDQVAVAHSLALYGGGLGASLGLAMDAPHGEAVSLDMAVGTAVGLGAGLYLADRVTVSRARMRWIDVGAAAGMAAPWALAYPLMAGGDRAHDVQWAGALSGVGLVAGVALAWWLSDAL